MADEVPAASAATVVWLGFAPDTTGSTVDTHPALEAGCGAAVCPDAVVRAWLDCPPPDATVSVVGVLPPLAACVALPSVPALPGGGPPPPLNDEPAWRIAWRKG